MSTRRMRTRRKAETSQRFAVIGISAAVVALGALVAPQAFAGTLPGSGVGAAVDAAGVATGQRDGSCADVELVFARGTGEPQGLGIVGRPLAGALADELPGKSVDAFAVVYDAAFNQASAGPGATNMTEHLTAVAGKCPNTTFVIGGYSQGATVTDVAMGIPGVGTPGDAIPQGLESRVAAVVAFGNPLGLRRQTIEGSSADFGPKAKEFCNDGDPVCGNGNNLAAHLAYPRNGSVEDAAAFAASKINGS